MCEALNSGKIVKATKRMYPFYLCAANSWAAVAHFPPTSQAPRSPIPANNEEAGLRARALEQGQRKLMMKQEMQQTRTPTLLLP